MGGGSSIDERRECISPDDISSNPDVIKADYSGELICKLMHAFI